MARIEGAFEQIDRRLTTLEQGIAHLNSRIDRLMYWQLGLLGAIAASTVAIVLTR
jgi:hypothetical protein